MAAALNSAAVYTDFQGLTALKAEAREQSPEVLKAVAKQFEALFLQMMLKSMREASEGDPLFDGEQAELYRDMYDKQLSLDMAEKGIGLADVLVRQLQMRAPDTAAAGAMAMPQRQGSTFTRIETQSPQVAPSVGKAAPVSMDEVSASPEAFIRRLWPLAEKAAAKIGASPEALLAQAALETGWGKAIIRHPDGSSSHNLFNIKADRRWDGESVAKSTLEYRDGVAAKEVARFRAYDSFEASFDDYVNFLQSNPRYAEALRRTDDPKQFVRALQDAGYATDPAYARKIGNILDRGVVADAAAALKSPGEGTLS
ncbi:flagellar assembly peptidoglycan hydrolase FlgJ [Sulfurivermis fontis]|uniref:flagellar assembly peptidoglycan hydrolase FlgJ n=1 Tax=Sulfurivermis fontis TaxID=1972068 RepID=UPI000FD84326|nr:flagellar assembly peptidoglycan hydrolase FlgJ [Sulfurivermis fontis]